MGGLPLWALLACLGPISLLRPYSPNRGPVHVGVSPFRKRYQRAASAEALVRPAVVRGAPGASLRRSHAVMVEDDSNPFLAAINGLQEAMQESPVATLKKGFAKIQAGDYDEAAVKAKLEAQISDTPAIMYSFTT